MANLSAKTKPMHLTMRAVHHGQPGSSAEFDRPLPLALKLG